MDSLSDQQLLRDYAERRSESAFAELVRRHVDLVYSAALRMVCDAHLAEDVAQGAFMALAQNAQQLSDRPVLSGWLHRTAQNLAANIVRSDVRRRAREQEAAAMNELLSAEPDAAWEKIAPHLDAALGDLSEPDRDALLLRYFERKSAHEIAQVFGISDEAAQKRVSRAVERLREFFSKRGVGIGAGGLIVLISANAVQSAPLGLTTTISTAAVLAGTTIHTSTAIATTKVIAMTTLQKTLLTATIAVLAGAGIHEARQTSHLREQNRALQQQQAPLNGQIQQLQRERDELANRLSALTDNLEKNKDSAAELLGLRAEVTRLRRDSQELAELKTSETNDPAQVELKTWLASVKRLKQEVQAHPELRIPEFSLLTEQDWLDVARLFGKRTPPDAQADLRVATANLRHTAEITFATLAQRLLANYVKEHGGNFPTDLSQFQPYVPNAIDGVPVDDGILQRYKVVPAEKLGSKQSGQDWVLTQKELVDDEYDHHIAIGPLDWSYDRSLAELLPPEEFALKHILDPVAKEYSAANNGQPPTDPAQLQPYLKTDEQKAAFQKVTELRNSHTPTNK
jgi:RNA polymerase sigma factor (sigma-70 family)